MRISINQNSREIIKFDKLNIFGSSAAGGYAFVVVLKGSRNSSEHHLTLFDARLSLALSDPRKPIAFSILSSNQTVECGSYPNNNEQIHFETVLTKEQINAIEEYRQEGDLKLGMTLRALLTSDEGLSSSNDFQEVSIPREEWLKALRDTGFRQTLLFEVPLPSCSSDMDKIISKAQEFIEIGHYKDAVMQCRHIIEQVEQIRGDKRQSSEANKKAHDRSLRESMSSIERLLSLREQLKNVSQLGAHGDEEFTRSQAKAVLGMTMVLLVEPTVGFLESLG